MFDTRTRLFFFACLKDVAGAALKKAAPAPGSDPKKIGSRRLWLRNTATYRRDLATGHLLERFGNWPPTGEIWQLATYWRDLTTGHLLERFDNWPPIGEIWQGAI